MSSTDHYSTLGLNRNADTKAIKAAFRRLAKQYHPDHNPRDPAAPVRFRQIVEAYDELVDHARRAAYDLTLRRSTSPSQPSPSPSSRYEPRYPGSRIDKAIETFDHLTRDDWRGSWRRHVHARIFLQALDEVCEFEQRLIQRIFVTGFASPTSSCPCKVEVERTIRPRRQTV
jgi:curved DNA-binding protein CbpA